MDHHFTDFRKALLFWTSTTELVKTSAGKISNIVLTMSQERGWGMLKDTIEMHCGKCRMQCFGWFIHSLVRICLPVLSIFDLFMSLVPQLCESAILNCWIYCIHWHTPSLNASLSPQANFHSCTSPATFSWPRMWSFRRADSGCVSPEMLHSCRTGLGPTFCVAKEMCCIYPKRNFLVQL